MDSIDYNSDIGW